MTGKRIKQTFYDPDDDGGFVVVTAKWRHSIPAVSNVILLNKSHSEEKIHKNYYDELFIDDDDGYETDADITMVLEGKNESFKDEMKPFKHVETVSEKVTLDSKPDSLHMMENATRCVTAKEESKMMEFDIMYSHSHSQTPIPSKMKLVSQKNRGVFHLGQSDILHDDRSCTTKATIDIEKSKSSTAAKCDVVTSDRSTKSNHTNLYDESQCFQNKIREQRQNDNVTNADTTLLTTNSMRNEAEDVYSTSLKASRYSGKVLTPDDTLFTRSALNKMDPIKIKLSCAHIELNTCIQTKDKDKSEAAWAKGDDMTDSQDTYYRGGPSSSIVVSSSLLLNVMDDNDVNLSNEKTMIVSTRTALSVIAQRHQNAFVWRNIVRFISLVSFFIIGCCTLGVHGTSSNLIVNNRESESIISHSGQKIERSARTGYWGRYVKVSRTFPSQDASASNTIHILGIDVYNTYTDSYKNMWGETRHRDRDRIITSTPFINKVNNNDAAHFGAAFLTDGVHSETKADGSLRLPHTTNDPDVYMQLDFGSDKEISWIKLWNRVNCCSNRITGCTLSIITSAGYTIFAQSITSALTDYTWDFRNGVTNNAMTDSNIQNAAYQWVTNNAVALNTYGDIRYWDTSRVTTMDNVFGNLNPNAGSSNSLWAQSFNGDVSIWDTSKVISMYQTFAYAKSFNGDLSKWNTGKVTSMKFMFYNATLFNGYVSTWNINQVKTLYGIFYNANSFNCDLSTWQTNQVTDMSYAFYSALSFNGVLLQWNTSQVNTMNSTFNNARLFNSDLSRWDTSQVTNMDRIFYGATNFNRVLCLDTSRVSSNTAFMFSGSGGSFDPSPYPYCRGFSFLAFKHSAKLIPPTQGSVITLPYNYMLPALTLPGQQRIVYQIYDQLNTRTDYTLDPKVQISFNFLVSERFGRRHSICFLESESDLSAYCSSYDSSCLNCFDIAGNSIQGTLSGYNVVVGNTTEFKFKPLDSASKQSLNGKNIRFIAFINDADGDSPSPTSTFTDLYWIRYQSLNITSPSNSELFFKFADPAAAPNIEYFKHTLSKVTASYSSTIISIVTYARDLLISGVNIDKLEAGIRYSILLEPAYSDGTVISGQTDNQFFEYGIVKCTCPGYVTSDQTGTPIQLFVQQSNGFVSMMFTDNSVCEEAYAFTRRAGSIQSIFAPNYYFYSTTECGSALNPGLSYADDLSMSLLDIGNTYNFCAEAISMNYMSSSISLFAPNRVSSDPACQDVRIAWEASIKGLVTSKADTGSIPIESVNITWTLMDPNNIANPLNCTNSQSMCSGTYVTNSDGSFRAIFFVDEPQLGLTRTDPVPILLTFSRSLIENEFDTFLANDEKTDISVGGTVVYLKHLQFDRSLSVVDASTVAFMGTVFVRNTEYGSYYGCPVADVEVCAYELKKETGGRKTQYKLACHNTESDGIFNLPLPIGAIVHNVTLSYFNHEFLPAASNYFTDLYEEGIRIDPTNNYAGNDFVDTTIAPINIDVVGGLCNKTLGTAFIQYRILGCSWEGATLHQTNHFATHYVPAHVVKFFGVTVRDARNSSISILDNFFGDKEKTKDLRKWIDSSAASANLDSDASGAQLGVTSSPLMNQTTAQEYVRFQYDGQLKLILNVTSVEIARKCKQECSNPNSTYFQTCSSLHVINAFSIVEFNVPVFFEILPGLKCDIVEDGTIVTLRNHLGYENIPNFEQSDFYSSLPSDEKEMIMKCYPSCENEITYTNNDGQPLSGAGLHDFSLFAGRVEITSPYTRLLAVKVSGYTSSGEFQEFDHRAHFVIQGLYKDGDGLSFAFPTHKPAMILRDPPGGSSFAFYENVQTTLAVDTQEWIDTLDNEFSAGLALNTGVQGMMCAGIGVMFCVDHSIGQKYETKTSNKLGGRVKYWKTEVTTSRSIAWTYQTSTDPWLAGVMSNIFVVPNLNVMYQQVRTVQWRRDSCTVYEICDSIGCPRLPMDIVFDLHAESTKEALAFYSRYHIESVKLQELNIALGVKKERLQEMNSGVPVCGTDKKSRCTESDKNKTILEIKTLENGLDGWNVSLELDRTMSQQLNPPIKDWGSSMITPVISSQLSSNAVLLSTLPPGIKAEDVPPLENINRVQFSGGGNTMSMTLSLDSASTNSKDKPGSNVYNDFTIEGPEFSFEAQVGGNGIDGTFAPLKLTVHHEFTHEITDGSEHSTSISFELGDDDPEDEFVVELYVDNYYGGIIFKTIGGRSKCPHELGTAAVEIPYLEVVRYPSTKVSVDNDLLFYVDGANKGVGISTFTLTTDLSLDSDGLEIFVDGVNLGFGLDIGSIGSFNNLSPEKYRKLVRIKRGPNQLIHPSLQLSWTSSCENANSDVDNLSESASVSVDLYNAEDAVSGEKYLQWIEKCPSIEWAGSIKVNNGFLVTTQDDMNTLSVSIFNPGHNSAALKDNSRLQASSTGVFLLYRTVGAQKWSRGQTLVNDTNMDSNFVNNAVVEDPYGYIQLNWVINSAFVQDGNYEITVNVVCDSVWGAPDEFRLSSVIGAIDRSFPRPYGYPSPIDKELHIGQEISLLFTKPLLCFPIPFNIQIVVGGTLTLRNEQLLIDCHDNKIGFVVDMTKIAITKLVGQNFTVEMGRIYTGTAAIRDSNGNPTDPNKGNIIFEKSFLPLGVDMQTSFVLSASSTNSSVCSVCGNSSIPAKNCTTVEMRRYQESLMRNKLSLMMTLNATDRISISSIDCVSKTITGTVIFTDPPKPTPLPTSSPSLNPSRSMRPTRWPTKRPSKLPVTQPTVQPTAARNPTTTPSIMQSMKPTLKPSAQTTTPSRNPTIQPTQKPTRVQFRSTRGLIYNKASGQCLSFDASNAAVMASCDSTDTNQQWYSVQKYSESFALVSSSNRSLDGGDTAMGSYIALVERNESAISQLWTYDGTNHLKSKYNHTLCITPTNTTSTVQLSSCSQNSYSYNQVWDEFYLYGGSGGSIFTYYICPAGEKVVNITGRAGAWINALSMTCDGGQILGPVGSMNGGYQVSGTSCLEGYTGVSVTSGSYVGKLSVTCTVFSGSKSFGLASGSYGSGSLDVIQCHGNDKIIGFYSRYGNYVDSINFICGPVLTSPTARPTTKPTMGPTAKPTRQPSARPTAKPTLMPTRNPSAKPTLMPSWNPTAKPTPKPSAKPTSKPSTATPSRKPTLRPTAKPTKRPTGKPSKRPTKRPSARPTRRPISSSPSKRPRSVRPTRRPSKRPTRRPSRRPSKKPSHKPEGRRVQFVHHRRVQSVHNIMKSSSSVDLLMDLLQNMVVSDHIHHGRYLLSTNTSHSNDDVLFDVRISDVVLSSQGISVSTDPTQEDPETSRKWLLLGTNSSVYRQTFYNHPLQSDIAIHSGYTMAQHVTSVKDDLKKEMSSMDNKLDSMKTFIQEEVMKQNTPLENKLDSMKTFIQEEVMKQNKPLEEKLERIVQLLERVVVL